MSWFMHNKKFGLTVFQYNLLFPALLMVAGVLMAASIDIYLPAAPYLTRLFNTNELVMQFSMMLSPMVAAFTGLLYGHWSDSSGRRPAMLSSLALFAAGSVLTAVAWNIESFLFFRLIQAFGAGGISVISISILSDMFSGAVFARYMATYSMSFPIMFAVAPVIGAHLFEWFGWQANFWFLAVISSVLCICFYFCLPETNAKHKDTLKWHHLFINIKKLFADKNFMALATGHGLPVAIAAIFSANSSFLYINSFAFSPKSYAYIQLIPVVFNLLGSIVFRQMVTPWGMPKSVRMGLYVSSVFLLMVSVGVFWHKLQLPIPVIVIMCFINFSLSACISGCGTMALEYDQSQRGLAVAVLGLFRSGMVAVLVLFVGLFFDGTVIPVYIGIGVLTAILLFVTWPYVRIAKS